MRLLTVLFGLSVATATSLSAASALGTQAPPISVNGQHIGVPALERKASVFVPLRGVFEKLHALVVYDAGSITASRHGSVFARLRVGSRQFEANGVTRKMAVAPFLNAGRVMVPLRVISQAAGATVIYAAAPRSVAIAERQAPIVVAPVAVATAAVTPASVAAAEPAPNLWWLWLLLALAILGLIAFLAMRRKKEPIIVTSGRSSAATKPKDH